MYIYIYLSLYIYIYLYLYICLYIIGFRLGTRDTGGRGLSTARLNISIFYHDIYHLVLFLSCVCDLFVSSSVAQVRVTLEAEAFPQLDDQLVATGGNSLALYLYIHLSLSHTHTHARTHAHAHTHSIYHLLYIFRYA